MRTFYLRIILPTIITVLLFILSIFLIMIPRYKENIMDGKREMIKELTNSAWSILLKYENDERAGLLTREQAQSAAISRIQYLRYGEESKDYFWITDMAPRMIMHPFRNDLNGKDLTNFKDPHGKRLFVEFVETVKNSEHGYVDYMWQWKDDSLHIVPKLSYVKIFKPWNWVIGTGIYIEDAKKEIAGLTQRLVWISIGISALIALMLFYILQQSLKIEHKRIEAENELHESKEKYKTLVEAATEGLLMLIEGKISYSNNIISQMTGFEAAELVDFYLNKIIAKCNNKDIIETFSKSTIKEGQFELSLCRKNGGFIEVLVTSSTAIFYGKAVNILIVKDISIDKNLNVSTVDYQKIINTLNIGFFKVKIDSKGKFLYANDTAIRILGFDSFKELSDTHLLALIADTEARKSLNKTLLAEGFLKNKILRIMKKNGDISIMAVSLVMLHVENSDDLICDGIIEDITLLESNRIQTNELIAGLKANDFVLEQPVSDYVKPITRLDADAPLTAAIQLLSKRKTDNILLTKNDTNYIGIITNSDVQKRILALNLKLDNPSYLIMSAPVVSISEDTSIYDAMDVCDASNINHLVVKNALDEFIGVLSMTDIYRTLKESRSFLITTVRNAETDAELKQCFQYLHKLVKPLIDSGTSVQYITNITTSFSDAVIRRIIELELRDIGHPPVGFSFICLGSEGRSEETLYTDQDNAIVYDDVPKEKEGVVSEYFIKLGERVCNRLDYIGYSFCKGNIMARNSQWNKPFSVWEKYFTDWVTTPEPQNLLDASIFFDFRRVYGDDTLIERLNSSITRLIKANPLFLYHLAYNTYNIKSQHLSSGGMLSDKNTENIDLKSVVIPLIMLARTYSLKNSISYSNTLQRLNALKDRHILNEFTADEMIYAYNFLMKLRFRNQLHLSVNNLPLSNTLNAKKLIDFEYSMLKKILSTIPDYQNKIRLDFGVTT